MPHVECYEGKSNEWYDATDMNINRSALKACLVRDLNNVVDFTHYGHNKDRGGDSHKPHASTSKAAKTLIISPEGTP